MIFLKFRHKTKEAVATCRALRKNLKELRNERRLDMQTVSIGCGLHKDAYRRYECGEVLPTLQALADIASYYDVTVDYLLGRDTERKRASAFCTPLTEKTGGKKQE